MIRLTSVGIAAAIVGVAGLVGAGANDGASAVKALTPFAVAIAAEDNTDPESNDGSPQTDESYFHDDEIAVASLDPTGLPIKTYVTGRVSSKGGPERTVLDPFTTANVEYLNRRGEPVARSGGVDVTVGGPEASTTLVRGLMDKPLPVALHAEYKLNGEVVEPAAVLGAAGELEVKYTVTNTDVEPQKISYTDASGKTVTKEVPVFAPLIGNLLTALPTGWEATDTSDASVSTDDSGDTLLRWNLLVYPPLGSFTQELTYRATIDSGIIPGTVMTMVAAGTGKDPASSFSDELLKNSVSGNKQLSQGLDILNEQTLALAAAADQLASGLAQLAKGAATGNQEVADKLVPGSEQVAQGTVGVALGQAALTDAVNQAAAGAKGLSEGTTELETGMRALTEALGLLADEGLPQLRDGAEVIEDVTNQLADVVGSEGDPPFPLPSPSLPPIPTAIPTPSGIPTFPIPTVTLKRTPTLYQATEAAVLGTTTLRDQLVKLNNNLLPILTVVAESASNSKDAATESAAAAAKLEPLIASLCSPPLNPPTPGECADLAGALAATTSAATTSSTVATALDEATVDLAKENVRSFLTAAGSNVLLAMLEEIRTGVDEVGKVLRSGSDESGDQGIVAGLEQLVGGLDQAIEAAEILAENAQTFSQGTSQLTQGATELSSGLDQTGQGAAELSAASRLVSEGATITAFGTAEVATALSDLTTGLDQSEEGSVILTEGASQLQSQGTQELLETVIASSAQPAEAVAYLAATNERANTALPYGPPEGATGSAAYIMTIQPVTPNTTSAWLIAALVLLVASALGGAVAKQMKATR
jgi:X-X-X-Leu-X-X-Gly heptad repeat protein